MTDASRCRSPAGRGWRSSVFLFFAGSEADRKARAGKSNQGGRVQKFAATQVWLGIKGLDVFFCHNGYSL
jgi:hypothetical protein